LRHIQNMDKSTRILHSATIYKPTIGVMKERQNNITILRILRSHFTKRKISNNIQDDLIFTFNVTEPPKKKRKLMNSKINI
jgi:hypothetical protein